MDKKPVLAIMRPETHTDASEEIAEQIGFQPLCVPVVAIKGMKDDAFDGFVRRVMSQETNYVIFTSANGIDFTLKNLEGTGVDETTFREALKKVQLVAIGPATRKRMESCGLTSSLMPGEYSSEGLVNDLGKAAAGKVIDIPRSFYGSEVLVLGLKEAGATVYQTHVYTLDIPESGPAEELIDQIIDRKIDAFAFTSTMMVKNFMSLADKMGEKDTVIDILNDSLVGAIGYPTAQTVESFGVKVDVVPEEFTFEALVRAMKEKADAL
ncbi:MAG: uroporphyrinogen-III synthase [Methanimicrococcus sp.]|nr:uroporphyrinogen-III synthase [Methanimicrococcus sp.]